MPQPRPARVYQGTPRNLAYLASRLRAGELVAVPTETVYGLAANALDPAACRKIFAAKGRPATDPLIVHVSGIADVAQIARLNAAARKLAKQFWPGPLTLVLPKTDAVPDVVSSGLPSVAVRVPAHPVFRQLLTRAGIPLAAPSANPFGYISPTTAQHVLQGLGNKIPAILDGGASAIGLESTIVDLRDPKKPRLLRPGAITHAQLERVLQIKVARPVAPPKGKNATAQIAPGLLTKHYSPRTPLVLHATLSAVPEHPREARLFITRPAQLKTARSKTSFWLDDRGNLHRAAHRLFAKLRELDAAGFRKIHAEVARGGGLADAINDRLRRAAAK